MDGLEVLVQFKFRDKKLDTLRLDASDKDDLIEKFSQLFDEVEGDFELLTEGDE